VKGGWLLLVLRALVSSNREGARRGAEAEAEAVELRRCEFAQRGSDGVERSSRRKGEIGGRLTFSGAFRRWTVGG